jgi:signal transduction histidine kinase
LRIARDLHDITGHHLSAIALQAGGASQATSEPLARQALGQIHELARSALNQTRRAVGLLREDTEDATPAPLPRLDSLEHLLAAARTAGVTTHLLTEGPADELPEMAEVCAYRVVQESLTNVVRHAGAHTVTVSLRYGPKALTITVQDDGRGRTPPGRVPARFRTGAGLTGMHERLALVGGTLSAGPDNNGWVIRACIPIGGGS